MARAIFEIRGQDIYQNLAKCEGCHGPKGVGGQAPYVITDENAKFVAEVNWNAPALNTVLWRFSEAEVKDIITYGRPGTPMQPWGVAGGGALSDQQLDNVIDYLWSFQLTEAAMHTQVLDAVKAHAPELEARLADVIKANEPLLKDPLAYECETGTYVCLDQADQLRLGEILFNLNDVAAGAYSCSRCHVPGASYGEPWQPIDKIGRGRYGPNLIGIERDMTVKQHYDLVMKGTEDGRIYGANHQGSGRMPGFGINPNTGDPKRPPLGNGGMYQPEEVWAIVQYERNMSTQFADIAKIVGTSTSSTTTTVPVSAVAANTGAKP